MTPEAKAARDALLIYAPPARLVRWLERVFAAKAQQGQPVPPEFTAWLRRWEKLRNTRPGATSVLSDEEWEALGELMPE